MEGEILKLAELLNINPFLINDSLRRLQRGTAYRVWSIPKKSGGRRQIQAALPPLNTVQAGIASLIYPYSISNISHGFVHGRSHRTAALAHLLSDCMFCWDIKDAFPSVKRNTIESRLYLDSGFSKSLAGLMTELLCFPAPEPFLPQGHCSSPYIFNLVLKQPDRILERFAQIRGYNVTRYVDNFAMSAQGEIPEGDRNLVIRILEAWTGFEMPLEKTQYFQGIPFEFLGLKIFEDDGERKLGVSDEKLADYVHAIYEAIESRDYSKRKQREIKGKLNYLKSVYKKGLPEIAAELYREYQLRGQLSFNF